MLAEANHSDNCIVIDDGAIAALHGGGSLLPVGITRVVGDYQRGDVVRVRDQSKKEICLGMVNYGSVDLEKIMGKQSHEIESLLGYMYGEEVMHHNNLLFV